MRAERGRASPRGIGTAACGGGPRRNSASVGKGPVELWTSPSGQPATCGTCGQAVDEAGASPTALTTLAGFSTTGSTGQPQQQSFQNGFEKEPSGG